MPAWQQVVVQLVKRNGDRRSLRCLIGDAAV